MAESENTAASPAPKQKRALDELLQSARARGAGAGAKPPAAVPVLVPVRHPQKDFFIADIMDVSAKDDIASMEYPLFILKAGDKRVREYTRNNVSIKIMPGAYGCATIHDKDVWIYCISQLVEGMNRDRKDMSRTVRFIAYDFLVTTNRDTSGRAYERMSEAMNRLAGTRIETNIETAEQRERQGFGLIDSWRVIEKKGGRMVCVEVTLPDWLYRSIEAKQVLTISPDYFRIRKPLDRRIYELARKHCGNQKQWQCGLETLHRKSGSNDSIRKFRASVKVLVEADLLPDYTVTVEHDVATFTKR